MALHPGLAGPVANRLAGRAPLSPWDSVLVMDLRHRRFLRSP
ncbi:hypothetical protein STXM2123_381 [Streptomyces sp. F-3]|nr:hypothetical protein STXM2123_381 [Streptomyces sp. F-3]